MSRSIAPSFFRPAIALVFLALAPCPVSANDDRTCASLRKFISSVKTGETKSLQFRTSWGGNFNDVTDDEPVLYAKRCEHHDYPPARTVCAALMTHAAVESAHRNAEKALTCLMPGTTFASKLRLVAGEFEFTYGSENRGSDVKIRFGKDAEIGGMVMEIIADGH